MSIPPRTDNRVLRLNVGFLLKESAGYARDFEFQNAGPLRVEDVAIIALDGRLRLSRTRQGIVVQGTLRARSMVECVRCLTAFELPYDVEIADLFVYPPPVLSDPHNLTVVDEGGFIDLAPIIREEGILAVPMQAVCHAGCKGLCPQCGQDLNEAVCGCVTEDVDPRLEGLRALLKP